MSYLSENIYMYMYILNANSAYTPTIILMPYYTIIINKTLFHGSLYEEVNQVCYVFFITEVIDSVTRDVVNYNTGLSVVSSGDTLLLADEAEIVIAHGLFT